MFVVLILIIIVASVGAMSSMPDGSYRPFV